MTQAPTPSSNPNDRPPRPQPTTLRRVRGGVKLAPAKWPDRLSPIPAGVLESLRPLTTPDVWHEGLALATKGQTRTLDLHPGRLAARVQGLRPRAFDIEITFETFSAEQWETALDAISRSAKYAAKLLSGQAPEEILELFESIGMPLPPAPSNLAIRIDGAESDRLDEQAACAALLLIDRLDREPLSLFTCRGLEGEALVERLRDRHALASSAGATAPSPGQLAKDGREPEPLETCLDHFWDAGPELDLIETTPLPPETATPLLRRLGPSPFEAGKFPLVGLLATCYEVVSRDALEGREDAGADGPDPANAD